jgi:hypothetical protein
MNISKLLGTKKLPKERLRKPEKVPQYPIFRSLCPEMPEAEFNSMRTVVCGWMFGHLEVPSA